MHVRELCYSFVNAGLQARRRQGREAARPLTGLCSGLRMLGRSPLFLKLTACVMLTGIVMEGMYELLAQYFQLKLAYTAADQVCLFIRAAHVASIPAQRVCVGRPWHKQCPQGQEYLCNSCR